jgi:hypothetical protein
MRPLTTTPVDPFVCVRVHELADRPAEQAWDIQDLWAASGVGVLAGQPKSSKTWTALDMALSVASGTPCLGHFPVVRPGAVLLYAAEDPLPTVRVRLAGLARQRGLDLATLPIHVIDEPAIRLDRPTDRERLRRTLALIRPRLLILDPLVRVYGRIDENSVAEVSALLAYLRALQREHDVSVVVVHHARKAQGAVHQAGQALRGSGDFFAWSDTMLYLRRIKDGLLLTRAHRSAPSGDPLVLKLVDGPDTAPHLEVAGTSEPGDPASVNQRILHFLTRASAPVTTEEIRGELSLRKERVVASLQDLLRAGRIRRQERGWCRTPEEVGGTETPADGSGT